VRSATAASESSPGLGVVFDNAEKRFGSLVALRRFSLEFSPGEFVVLVGPNGSGKTTLLRMAALLSRPSAGQVRVKNDDGATGAAIKSHIGVVGHSTMLYDELTAGENLRFFARLYNLRDAAQRAAEALEPAGLASRTGDLVRTFSRGMRQRLAIARALLASPLLLLLDEPAAGLDREGVGWLASTLAELKSRGATIVMSLHGQSEIGALATRAIAIHAGSIFADSKVEGTAQSVIELEAGISSPVQPNEAKRNLA